MTLAVDYNKPTSSTFYVEVLPQLQLNINDALSLSTETSGANYPTNTVKFRNSRFEKWNGTSWSVLSTGYAISITGNANTVTNGVYTNTVQSITAIKTFTSQVKLAAGTASAPQLANKDNSDTGIYFPSIDSVGVSINGQNALTIDSGRNLTCAQNITAYSDKRLKKDFETLNNALQKVKTLHGYLYTKIETNRREVGLISQEVEKILPEAVFRDKNGYLSLAYGNLAALFVEAIKELDTKIQALEQKIQ